MPPKRKKGSKCFRSKSKTNKVAKRKYTRRVKTEEKENSDNEHNCKKCSMSFVSKDLMLVHMKMCKTNFKDLKKAGGPKYSCNECTKKFKFVASFVSHLNNEHSKLPGSVACSQCIVRCPNKSILKKHISDVHERKIFECPHCKKEFVRYAHVLRHLSQKGCDGQEVLTFPCEICNVEFSRKDNLMVHLRLQHIAQKAFACKVVSCPYSTSNFSKLLIHVQKYHTEKPLRFECDHCGKSTSSRIAIAKHLETHGEKKFACDVCGYSAFTIEVMRRHVLTHVRDKPHKCKHCDQSFIQRAQLQRHLERHNDKKQCTTCGKLFNTKSEQLAHSAVHMGMKKFVCPMVDCLEKDKEFPDEQSLQKHIKKDMELKRYLCEVCNKYFQSETYMRRHMSYHTLERPRRCMYCVAARAYVRGEQLLRHVRKAHPDVFRDHLTHVRQVLGITVTSDRVKKSELDTMLNVLDAEAERIIQGYGEGVLYGGMQEATAEQIGECVELKNENNPLMSEQELVENIKKLLSQLIDKDTLECFGWPNEDVDTVLEKVIEQCGARPADRSKWTRVQCLRENTKHLFLYVIEDKNIARMLDTHTIDQTVKHILIQVSENDEE